MSDQDVIQEAALSYLGVGYKGWEFYADPQSCMQRIFDLTTSPLQAFTFKKGEKFTRTAIAGKSVKEYFDKLSANIDLTGGYSGFSATLTATFSDEVLNKKTCEFATVLDVAYFYIITLSPTIKPSGPAQSAIDTWDPKQLFNQYGTHYTKSICLGGRVTYSSYLDQQNTTSKTDIGSTLKANYLKLASGGGGASNSSKDDEEAVARNASLAVIGGDPGVANSVSGVGNPADFASTYSKWSTSIWPGHVSIADFDQGGLAPLYELATTLERRSELEKAWRDYMITKTPPSLNTLSAAASQTRNVRYGDYFYLKYHDGTYLSAYESLARGFNPISAASALLTGPALAIGAALQNEYYPTLRSTGRVRLQFRRGDEKTEVKSGEFLQLVTTENVNAYKVLGAWKGETCVYYYTEGYENQDWVIQRSDGKMYQPLGYGETVFIGSRSFPDQRLCSGDVYGELRLLTTKTTDRAGWILELAQ